MSMVLAVAGIAILILGIIALVFGVVYYVFAYELVSSGKCKLGPLDTPEMGVPFTMEYTCATDLTQPMILIIAGLGGIVVGVVYIVKSRKTTPIART